jgi:phospholipase/lecithinase/hemolysin
MRFVKQLALGSITALLLAACGGGSEQAAKVTYSSVVSFGDSLSDAGTYGSMWLVNGISTPIGSDPAPSYVWPQLLAAAIVGKPSCAARSQLGGTGTVTDVTGCTNYAQGGSRVKDADGTNHAAGAATEPVTVQIEKFLALAPNSKFKGTELVTVQGGANDLFAQAKILETGATAAGTAAFFTAREAGKTMEEATAASAAAGAAYAAGAGAYAAVNNMSTAGKDLADAVKLVIASGAKKVVVMNIPDASQTPYGVGAGPQQQPLILAMVQAFNNRLKAELAGQQGVLLLDVFAENQKQFLNPTQFGLTNVTTEACTTSAASCNLTNVVAGDISHYLFADDVHPTPYGHKLLAQFVNKELVLAGWL